MSGGHVAHLRRLLPLAVLAALSATVCSVAQAQEPSPADAREAGQDEARRYPPSSVRSKLVIGGLTLTGLAYGAAALSGTQWNDVPGADALKVPIVGPWIALGQNDCAPDDPDCGFILYLRGFLTLLDGIIQAGGLGIAGEGLFMTTEADVPDGPDAVSREREERTLGLFEDVAVMPIVTPNATGLGVVATF